MATRCCWPPESSPGIVVLLVGEADLGQQRAARAPRPRPAARLSTWIGAIMTFSQRGLVREQIVLLEHDADVAAQRELVELRRSVHFETVDRGCVPLSIGTSALMQRSKVDLPEPDGPMMQTVSPSAHRPCETPFSTWQAAEALLDVAQHDDGRGRGRAVMAFIRRRITRARARGSSVRSGSSRRRTAAAAAVERQHQVGPRSRRHSAPRTAVIPS